MTTRTTMIWMSLIAALVLLAVSSSVGARSSSFEPVTTPQAPFGVAAAVSSVLHYQGRLTNQANGQPVADGAYPMTFAIYDVPTGGAALWTETKNVLVTSGLFSASLGDTSPLTQTLFNGQALYLGIKVGADLEATPRQAILPVAYALGLVPGAAMTTTSSSPAFRISNNGGGAALHVSGPTTLAGNVTITGTLTGGAHNHDGSAITSGTVADARIAATIARDSEILPAVLAGDGAGSGLDADLLDGQHASAFVTSAVAENRYVNEAGPDDMSGNSAGAILAVTQNGAGAGVTGYSAGGIGVHGSSPNSTGVKGETSGPEPGVFGINHTGTGSGVYGYAGNSNGVFGESGSTYGGLFSGNSGVYGQGSPSVGGYFTSTSTYGVQGETASTSSGRAGIVGASGWTTTTFNRVVGVLGQSLSGYGVAGASTNYYGTLGLSYYSAGVRGEAVAGSGAGVSGGAWGTGAGVSGNAYGTGVGVLGSSSSSHGVQGTGGSGSGDYGGYFTGYGGVYGNGSGGYGGYFTGVTGVYGYGSGNYGSYFSSEGDYGVYGTANTYGGYFRSDGMGYTYGVVGTSVSSLITSTNYGVYGSASGGAALSAGVYGYAPSGPTNLTAGVLGRNNSAAGAGVLAWNYASGPGLRAHGYSGNIIEGWSGDPPGGTLRFRVDNAGNVYGTTKNAIVQTQDYGERVTTAMESPENWFEDFGSGQLVNGQTTVAFEPIFAQTVNLTETYHVFVTPLGDQPVLLFVSAKTPAGFTVRGVTLDGQPANVAFDWRVAAKRLGFENIRLRTPDTFAPAASMPAANRVDDAPLPPVPPAEPPVEPPVPPADQSPVPSTIH